MTAINFQKQFAPKVADGSKTHTIRKRRNKPIQKGDWLQLYTGMRTQNCQRLAIRICTKVESIIIDPINKKVVIGDTHLNTDEIYQLAIKDGFTDTLSFFHFFTQYPQEVLDKDMVIIHWRMI